MTSPSRPEEGADAATDLPTPAVTPTAPTAGASLVFHTAPSFELSGRFGRYEIGRCLGKGGMGCVYLARDTHLDRQVALKVPFLAAGESSTLRERFAREARAAATLHHPNICPVHDVGTVGEIPYLTMAYIEGATLHEWATQPRPVHELLQVCRTVALALHEAHRKGVIHRDLKPSNVMIDLRGEPVVMDFGLARRMQLDDDNRLTSPGMLLGTPAYMPPEHVQPAEMMPTPAGDIYSLGVMLYELLTGRCPFQGQVLSLLARIVSEPPAPPSQWKPGLDPRLDAICLRALAKRPEDRFACMTDLAAALTSVMVNPEPPVTPASPASTLQLEPRHALKMLEMLRTYGWARATHRIRQRADHYEPSAQKTAFRGFLDWVAEQSTPDSRAVEALQAHPEGKALRGWVLAGRASYLLRDRDYQGAQKLLEKAEAEGDSSDGMLQATIAHTRASSLVHLGKCDTALPHLHRALEGFGRTHFMTGRVLDTLGMAYALKGNFPIGREFYEQSIRLKQQCNDEAGIAVSHGQLGRLYLEWGHLDEAERHFQEDLRLALKLRSRWSETQIYNHLGQLALARGEKELAAGRRASARRQFSAAAGWLDQSIHLSREGRFPISEAFAHKDRALVYLHEGDLPRAEDQVRLALDQFNGNQFREGLAKTQMVEGLLLRRRENWVESERRFRSALAYFEETEEQDKVVCALLEIARTQRDQGLPTPLVTRAFLEALARAEASRHDPLVHKIEQELHEHDVEAYLRHIYRRARGASIDDDTPTLAEGQTDVGTVLAIDLPGFTQFAHGLDAETVLSTFNHLLADFADVLARHQARVLAYRGSGLLALTREYRHAERAVRAALDILAALDAFNHPRRLLDLPVFQARIGISSGDVLLGNVGTYHKMDFTAIGPALNLASAIRNEAIPGRPCVSRSTYEQIRDRYGVDPGGPRQVPFIGQGPVEVWDILGVR
ncbi:MAG: protein kinase [Gemmataceae bacterium]